MFLVYYLLLFKANIQLCFHTLEIIKFLVHDLLLFLANFQALFPNVKKKSLNLKICFTCSLSANISATSSKVKQQNTQFTLISSYLPTNISGQFLIVSKRKKSHNISFFLVHYQLLLPSSSLSFFLVFSP